MIFFDTNIFIYAASGALEDAKRRATAHQILANTDFGISTQVIQEFVDVALRKKRLAVTAAQVDEMVELMAGYPVATVTVEVIKRALILRNRYEISYWDAAIISAAQELGCTTVYSEDLNHGQNYDGIRVKNPFA